MQGLTPAIGVEGLNTARGSQGLNGALSGGGLNGALWKLGEALNLIFPKRALAVGDHWKSLFFGLLSKATQE